mgnify:FL=1
MKMEKSHDDMVNDNMINNDNINDYIIKATAAGGKIRAFACTSKNTCEKARSIHNTSPVATADFGRLLSAGLMMGSMMKSGRDLLTLRINGDGPLGGILVSADSLGHVKGYVFNPVVIIPANSKGKLDVAKAVGNGILSVISDIGMKEPYVGQTQLVSGEIAEDLAYYYAASEQIPSTVALGVLMDRDNTVKAAGGFIIQLMPIEKEDEASDIIDILEKRIARLEPVTTLLSSEKTPEDILEMLFYDMELEINEKIDAGFSCNCSRQRTKKALISIGRKDLQDLAQKGDTELSCHFCNKKYVFKSSELKEILSGGI